MKHVIFNTHVTGLSHHRSDPATSCALPSSRGVIDTMIKAPSKHVKFTKADSSNILEYGHDSQTSVLYIRFKSGILYGYPRVTSAMANEFHHAESKGKHFNTMGIRDRGEKITEA